jgi:hypothetical protein
MYLAFDTETTDLPRPHLDLEHPAQPYLLQFAGILFDRHGTELDRLTTLVRPGPTALLTGHFSTTINRYIWHCWKAKLV